MNIIQGVLQQLEVGKGSILIRLVPLLVAVGVLIVLSDFSSIQTPFISVGGVYRGLSDSQSMDNAQLARQIARGKGFTTEFLRPHAISQLHDFAVKKSLAGGKSGDLFPSSNFPPGTPRTLPDTYNAPLYPYLLAGWFLLVHPDFEETPDAIGIGGMYSPDRWIVILNQVFMLMTGLLVFILGLRLFDQRVAWMALVSYLLTEMVWAYSLTGLATSLLMFLTTAAFLCVVEIVCVGENCFDSEDRSFASAWVWGLILIALLAAIGLTRLQVLIAVVPVMAILLVMPSARVWLAILVALGSIAAVTPWYVHLNAVSGSYLGSNGPVVLRGVAEYSGNQIYCTTALPSYEQVFHDATRKEYSGLRWNFEHAWSLLGSTPMILFFGASALHQFKRRRTRLFHWMIFGWALALLLANNLGDESPDPISEWNALAILVPCMIVVGTAYFFILLDRLSLQLWLLNNLVVSVVLLFTSMSLVLTVLSPGFYAFNWPPYWPVTIKVVSQMAQPDEWVTSDMPWATAWYGDRASLWLPDQVTDFESFHDNICPTGMLLFTPVTWEGPMSRVTTGEYKDWYPLMTAVGVPANFPLNEHYIMQGKIPGYTMWSDRPRWNMK